jgi:hypothetical protein
MLSLFRMRAAIDPSLHVIMKDKDYIAPWACPPGRTFIDELGQPMKGRQLLSARNVAKQEWVHRNPKLAACLVGKDYTSQFEQRQKRDGYKKAKDFIKRKARASSIPANRFKFLWVSAYSVNTPACGSSRPPICFMRTTGTLQTKVLVFRGCRFIQTLLNPGFAQNLARYGPKRRHPDICRAGCDGCLSCRILAIRPGECETGLNDHPR